MKKTITIIMLAMAILMGATAAEAKTKAKKKGTKSRAKTSVLKARLNDTEGCDIFTFAGNGYYTWGSSDGGICDQGPYIIDGGAYILLSMRSGAYVLYNNSMYPVNNETVGYHPLVEWIASNGCKYENRLSQIFSFNPSSNTLSYSTDGISGSISLDNIDGERFTWVK